jgi:uncharacterized protein YkwD
MKKIVSILSALALTGGMVLAAAPTAEAASAETTAKMVQALNERRHNNGCYNDLINVTSLNTPSQYHASDMANEGYFSHDSQSPYESAGSRIWRMSGYPTSTLIAENIARNSGPYSTVAETVKAWMASPSHKAAIIDCRLNRVGVGVKLNAPTGITYWVTDFARR